MREGGGGAHQASGGGAGPSSRLDDTANGVTGGGQCRPLGCCCCCCGCRGGGPLARRNSAGRLYCPGGGGPRITLWLRRMLCLGGGSASPSVVSLGANGTASDTLLLDSDQELIVQRRTSLSAVQRSASSASSSSLPETDAAAATALYIRMIGPGPSSAAAAPGGNVAARGSRGSTSSVLTDADWLLLEGLDTRRQRPLHTGRFLTMHKRRRKRLATRGGSVAALGGGGPALLDDVLHGQVKCVLDRVGDWPFNAFILDTVTGGRSLPVLCVHLFHWYGLLEHFNLDVVRVWKLFTLIEEGYHGTNPYHNAIHATDVTQAMHCFLQERKIREHLTPLEIMAALLAAVTHDLDHPGVNQPFLIATSNHLAALYENTSVLENHHWRSAIGCLLESCVADQMGPHRAALEHQISSLILATDITRQQEFLTRFKRYLDCDLLDMRQEQDRHFILQIALKCADISNPCRPWDISKKWSQKVCEEFFRQGDYERRLNLPVTSLCDRNTTSVPKIQAGFFNFVVAPLMDEWNAFLLSPLALNMMGHLKDNQARWEQLLSTEMAEETRTEVSEADDIDEEDLAQLECPVTVPPSLAAGRRHSVPLSMPRLPVARTIIRRESLPEHPAGPRFPSETILHLECGEEESSTISLFSDQGSGSVRSLGPPQEPPRPLSADNLLPEPSIASITTSVAASRLSSVFHSGPGGRYLTRQQTFPPLHPSMHSTRLRHMPSTASEALPEASDSSACSTPSCHTEPREPPAKREPPAEIERSDRSKMAKLEGKENRAPCDKPSGSHRKPAQGSTRLQCRRGSAPVGLCKLDDSLRASPPVEYRLSRRGSVPSDGSRQSVLRALVPPCMPRRASLPYDPCVAATASTATSARVQLVPNLAMTSLPDTVTRTLLLLEPSATTTDALISAFIQGSECGLSSELGWVARRKLLRRRFSAGGPESVGDAAEPSAERLTRRRGSLPAELKPRSGASSEGPALPSVSS